MSRIRIGISGWNFEGWRGSFYPEGLRQKDELLYASRRVHAIEVNGTFYSLLKPEHYAAWSAQSPDDFIFSVKAPKYITHERRLRDFETPLANFLASGPLALGEKLGPILWQFPPSLAFDEERFAPFMAALPPDMATAAELGRGHSEWLAGKTFLTPPRNLPVRHAIEGRHASFRSPAFVELARRHGIAIVVGDTAGRWPLIEDLTSDFVYIRLHADETKYPEGYTREALEHWGRRLRAWAAGSQPDDAALVSPEAPIPTKNGAPTPRQVFAYFDNDTKETAPLNAVILIDHLVQEGVLAPLPPPDMAPVAAGRRTGRRRGAASVPASASASASASANADKPKKPAVKRPRQRA